jgi:hypothetical protein
MNGGTAVVDDPVVHLKKGERPPQVRAWRQFPEDPWAEAARLNVQKLIQRDLGWSRAHVSRVMNSVGSEQMFLVRVHNAIQDNGSERLLARSAPQVYGNTKRGKARAAPLTDEEARGYTDVPALGDGGEGAAVEDTYLERFAAEAAQQKVHDDMRRRLAYEEQPLEVRLAHLRMESDRQGIDLTRHFVSIEQRIRSGEVKLNRLGTVPSDARH